MKKVDLEFQELFLFLYKNIITYKILTYTEYKNFLNVKSNFVSSFAKLLLNSKRKLY